MDKLVNHRAEVEQAVAGLVSGPSRVFASEDAPFHGDYYLLDATVEVDFQPGRYYLDLPEAVVLLSQKFATEIDRLALDSGAAHYSIASVSNRFKIPKIGFDYRALGVQPDDHCITVTGTAAVELGHASISQAA